MQKGIRVKLLKDVIANNQEEEKKHSDAILLEAVKRFNEENKVYKYEGLDFDQVLTMLSVGENEFSYEKIVQSYPRGGISNSFIHCPFDESYLLEKFYLVNGRVQFEIDTIFQFTIDVSRLDLQEIIEGLIEDDFGQMEWLKRIELQHFHENLFSKIWGVQYYDERRADKIIGRIVENCTNLRVAMQMIDTSLSRSSYIQKTQGVTVMHAINISYGILTKYAEQRYDPPRKITDFSLGDWQIPLIFHVIEIFEAQRLLPSAME